MKKKKLIAAEIKQPDTLVVLCQKPGLQAMLGVQVIRPRWFWYLEFFHEFSVP
jgi:hypothetical protein